MILMIIIAEAYMPSLENELVRVSTYGFRLGRRLTVDGCIKENCRNEQDISDKKHLIMNRFGLIVIGLTAFYCSGTLGFGITFDQNSTALVEEGRRKGFGGIGGFHGLGHGGYHHIWGAYALAVLYFIKVKAVIVAFFVGAAAFWGFKYFVGKGALGLGGCGHEIIREGPIIGYDDHM